MRTPTPLWGYPSQEPLERLERSVDGLWEFLDEQHAWYEDMTEIVREIQRGVRALKER